MSMTWNSPKKVIVLPVESDYSQKLQVRVFVPRLGLWVSQMLEVEFRGSLF